MRTAFSMLMPEPMPPATYTCDSTLTSMSRLESMILMAEKMAAFARMNESISTSVMEISRPVSDSAAVARI